MNTILIKIQNYNAISDIRKKRQGYHDDRQIGNLFAKSVELYSMQAINDEHQHILNCLFEFFKIKAIFEKLGIVDIGYFWEDDVPITANLHLKYNEFITSLCEQNFIEAKEHLRQFNYSFFDTQLNHIYSNSEHFNFRDILLEIYRLFNFPENA